MEAHKDLGNGIPPVCGWHGVTHKFKKTYGNSPTVVHIFRTGEYSGAEKVAISIIKNTTDYNHVYVSPAGSVEQLLKGEGIKHYRIKYVSVCELRRAIKDIRPDIIHAHDFSNTVVSSFAGLNIPIISHLHNNPPWIRTFNFKSLIFSLASFRVKRLITVSESVYKEFVLKGVFAKKNSR